MYNKGEYNKMFKKNEEINEINKRILKYGIFPQIFGCLNDTLNGKAIIQFHNYLKKFSHITKWFSCSDYCLDDTGKERDVYTFVIFPYTQNFLELEKEISQNIKKEFKKVGKLIPIETLEYLNNNNHFVFNFIFPKDFLRVYLGKNFIKETEISSIRKYIDIIENNWNNNYSIHIINSLKKLVQKIEEKSFNFSLYKKIQFNSFLSAVISVFLQKEHKNVKVYSWLSDRDSMTTYISGLLNTMYFLRKEEIKKILKINLLPIKEGIYIPNSIEKPFYDKFISVPDYFCGTLASIIGYNENNNEMKELSNKYKQVLEGVLKNGNNVVTIEFNEYINDNEHRINSCLLKFL